MHFRSTIHLLLEFYYWSMLLSSLKYLQQLCFFEIFDLLNCTGLIILNRFGCHIAWYCLFFILLYYTALNFFNMDCINFSEEADAFDIASFFLFILPLILLLWPSFNHSGGVVSRDLDDLKLFYLLLIIVIIQHIPSPIFHLDILFSFKKQTLSQHGHTQLFWRCGHEWLWQHWVI